MFAGGAWQVAFTIGCASALLGMVMMAWQNKPTAVASLLVGLGLWLTAAWELVFAFAGRIGRTSRVLQCVSATLIVVLAASCMKSADWESLLALWIGMGWITHGIVQAIVAVSERELDTGRIEVYSLLTVLAGVAVIVLPVNTPTTLSVVLGCFLLMLGASEIHLSGHIDRAAEQAEVAVAELSRSAD